MTNPQPLDNINDLDACGLALTKWMQSQGLDPADGVILMEYFMVRMMIDNAKSRADYRQKLQRHIESISALHSILEALVR